MFEVALLFERGYLCLSAVAYVVARYSQTAIVNVLTYEVSVEAKGERERRQQRRQCVGGRTEEGRTRGLACAACLLFVLSSLLGEDVNLDRAAEGESPRRRFPPFEEAWLQLWQLKVVTSCGGT